MINKLQSFLHRRQAAALRARVAREQLDLDEYIATEQTRLSILSHRADWHEKQATVAPTTRAAAPQIVPNRDEWKALQLVPRKGAA